MDRGRPVLETTVSITIDWKQWPEVGTRPLSGLRGKMPRTIRDIICPAGHERTDDTAHSATIIYHLGPLHQRAM